MSQLRQLVIAAEDPVRLAGFYQEVFDLEKIDENAAVVFLSDGTFSLSLLRITMLMVLATAPFTSSPRACVRPCSRE